MAEYNNVEEKLEAAFQLILEEAVPEGCQHFTGLTAENLVLPKSWAYAHTGAEIAIGTGIFRVPMEIGVESVGLNDPEQATEELAAHNALVARVRDAVLRPDLIGLLNLAAAALAIELTIIDALDPNFAEDTDSKNYRNILRLDMIAANATI